MGERVGGSMLKTKKLWVILLLGFFLGVIITISEPDLQVLAAQVPSVPNMVLILSVAAGGWRISCCSTASYFIWNSVSPVISCVLWCDICDRKVCSG